MQKYRIGIGTIGEVHIEIIKKLSKVQYDFLLELFKEINRKAKPLYMFIYKFEEI